MKPHTIEAIVAEEIEEGSDVWYVGMITSYGDRYKMKQDSDKQEALSYADYLVGLLDKVTLN